VEGLDGRTSLKKIVPSPTLSTTSLPHVRIERHSSGERVNEKEEASGAGLEEEDEGKWKISRE
jgi:hypothetical protein